MLDTTRDASPFHEGEIAVQTRLGHRGIEAWARQIVRDHMPRQHREFHTALPFLVVGARDAKGRPWATILTGPDGFVTSPDAKTLDLGVAPLAGDPLHGALSDGADVGVLGIDLAARRRNRLNAVVARSGFDALTLKVTQTFGNCPQYIHDRSVARVDTVPARPIRGTRLTAAQSGWIASADTLFIASGFGNSRDDPTHGMDASHRGGAPGFVEVLDARRIRFPDYAGNQHYNTLGNIEMDARAGFLFVDFATGGLLHLTGRASIDWTGADRFVTLEIDRVVERRKALPLRWSETNGAVRTLRVIEKTRESADVVSFTFEARDGGPLPGFAAGQHLPLALDIPGQDGRVERSYSLSGPPAEGHYRISVKREPDGLASRHLHDTVAVGDFVSARAPSGEFMMPHGNAPLVLLSAGVGITPLLSMLHDLRAAGDPRPVHFIHAARNGAHHAFAREVRKLVRAHPAATLTVAYSQPAQNDEQGRDFDQAGRISSDQIAMFAGTDATVLICGPTSFMAAMRAGLRGHGISDDRILAETFGGTH